MGLSKRMGAEIANVVSYLGLGTSLFTTILGLVYLWYLPPSFKLKWDECGWTDPDEYTFWVECNSSWTSSWGLTGLPKFLPLLMGITGSVMHRPVLLQVMGFPTNFLQYGIWLIVQGIFANFGYDGKLGVISGWLSIFLGFTCVVCQVFGLKTDRTLELTGESALTCANTKAADSNENADEYVKDHTALATIADGDYAVDYAGGDGDVSGTGASCSYNQLHSNNNSTATINSTTRQEQAMALDGDGEADPDVEQGRRLK